MNYVGTVPTVPVSTCYNIWWINNGIAKFAPQKVARPKSSLKPILLKNSNICQRWAQRREF